MLGRYPHQLSGGQQQRIVIAMALMAEPALLIMDEPTTGLDVTVEAAVLDLVRELRRRHGTTILFISHNLGTVVRVCDRIGVMYAGELVEEGSIRQVFGEPAPPLYPRAARLPAVAGPRQAPGPLVPIAGQVSSTHMRPRAVASPRAALTSNPPAARRTRLPLPLPDEPAHRVQCVRAAELPRWERRRSLRRARRRATRSGSAWIVTDLRKVYRQRRGLFGSGALPSVRSTASI